MAKTKNKKTPVLEGDEAPKPALNANPTSLKVSDLVRDKHLGFEGKISIIVVAWQGYTHYWVHGLAPDGSPVSHCFHLAELELVENGPLKTPIETGNIKLGDKVTDTASGWTGVATAFEYHQSGCIRVEVTGKNQQTGLPVIKAIDEIQVKKVAGKGPAPQSPPRSGGRRSLEALPR